jgi:uncharacterized membrane protein YbhN (UPF0104 family)
MFQLRASAPSTTLWRVARTAITLTVTAAALLFLGHALLSSWSELASLVTEPGFLLWSVGLSLPYAACLFILSSSWYLTLRQNAPDTASIAWGVYVYCIANIAKYLPGNVFHFAGRQILGARAGWRHGAIAQASILEIGAIISSILLIALLAIGLGPTDITDDLLPRNWTATVGSYQRLAAFTMLAVGGVTFSLMVRLRLFHRLLGVSTGAVARAIAMCMIFFCLYAALVMLFASQLDTPARASPLYAIGLAYLLAWLAGFIVPGAPGGLGVRESVLILILAGPHGPGESAALTLGLGMRLISTLGDAIAAISAYAIIRVQKHTIPQSDRQSEWI